MWNRPGNKGWRELKNPPPDEPNPVSDFFLTILVIALWISIIIAVFCF
jgi:hypothetical protein